MSFRDLTIKRKLTMFMMGVSAAAALLACIVFFAMTTDRLKKSYHDDLKSLAQVLARNCEASLAFQLPDEAKRTISTLSARPSIMYAVIRDARGNLFAEYGEDPGKTADMPGQRDSPLKDPQGYAKAGEDIVMSGKVIGSLTLYDDMRGIENARTVALWMMFLAIMLSLVAVAALVAPLQKNISRPIIALSIAAERISRERDYSLRAEKQGADEIGMLVDAFNTMIGKIEEGNRELQKSEKRFQTLVDQAVDAMFLFDAEGRIVDVNQQACDSMGYARPELLAMTMTEIDAGRADGGAPGGRWTHLRPQARLTCEGWLRRKDGTVFPVEVREGLLEIGGRQLIMGAARDISDRRDAEAERSKLEAQLQQAQKMEAIGALAGGVAHDFNNVLSAIVGYASLAKKRMQHGDQLQQQYLEQILAASERAAGLTKSLLAFSRKQIVELRPVDVNELICRFQKILAQLIGEDIEFTVTCHTSALVVEADKGQLEQVLMNLATNARDAMRKGGSLQISTSCVEINDSNSTAHNISVPGMYAYVTVSDTGAGIAKEDQSHIFEPFFTTKEIGKGTGLGLAIVYGIIKKHNGFINVYSEPGRGTTFRIYLPLNHSSAVDELTKPAVTPPGGKETILLVEDDAQVRAMVKTILAEAGYTVLAAVNGADAVRVFREAEGAVSLILSDLIMPKMNGMQAFEEIGKIRSGVKAIFMSGYAADIIAQKGILEQGINYISKPLNPSDILIKVREVLDA